MLPRNDDLADERGLPSAHTFARMESQLATMHVQMHDLFASLQELRARRRALLAPRRGVPVLSPRELTILRLIAEGKENAEIAAELHFALGTIKLHVRDILKVMGCRTRAAAVAKAVRLRLI